MKRLDQVIAEKYDISRSFATQLIKKGKVLVSSQPILSPSKKVSNISDISIERADLVREIQPEGIEPEDIPLAILYEDDHVLVINKAPGISVHTSDTQHSGTIVNALLFLYPHMKYAFSDETRLGIVHRIDKETSGVLIIAKDQETKDALSAAFKKREVGKEYLAVVEGVIDATMIVEKPIARNKKDRKKMAIDTQGRYAYSSVVPIAIYEDDEKNKYTYVKVMPKTGRTHQIRVHLKSLGHPIVGDTIYNGKPNGHMLLHAHVLSIAIPQAGEKEFEAPTPEYFYEFFNHVQKIKEL
jgi:23S rRNA pseudouridine1911/1915/1917 synthase